MGTPHMLIGPTYDVVIQHANDLSMGITNDCSVVLNWLNSLPLPNEKTQQSQQPLPEPHYLLDDIDGIESSVGWCFNTNDDFLNPLKTVIHSVERRKERRNKKKKINVIVSSSDKRF
eukprot:TRINITY_DN16304_c0_g1_i1.p1 TRINITY_DN16304_c0_g1~~TRINITY_DN16304_c0_g1_i1.p1  ORF type:complete len:117 (-),score=24.55 TRINITY_DN16304_c0_g1_i1:59-409(-)